MPRASKGARLWLEPARERDGRKDNAAVWVIKDGGTKRSTGCRADDLAGAEQALKDYLAEKHEPPKRDGDPAQVLIADIISVFWRDVGTHYARPKETQSRLERLLAWWGDPETAERSIAAQRRPRETMTGTLADIRPATCQAYVAHVGAARSASMDLELLRAAAYHAHGQHMVDRRVTVALPPKSLPRERWLTRSEVATLIWLAWRTRRHQEGKEDTLGTRQHVARWMVCARYLGSRKASILIGCFERRLGSGFIDLDRGVWYRRGAGVRATKKRQPAVIIPGPLLAHLRRWRRNGQTYAVEFNRQPVTRIDKAFRAVVAEAVEHGLLREAEGSHDKVIPHTFRHTAITWAMQDGMDPYDAADYFGIDLKTLLDVYGHHAPEHQRRAVAIIENPRSRQSRTINAADRKRAG